MAATGPQALGDYLLIEQVGEGGMAEVYRAQYVGKGVSLGPNTEVVVKRIKPSLFKSTEFPIFREMFLQRSEAGARAAAPQPDADLRARRGRRRNAGLQGSVHRQRPSAASSFGS